MSPLLAVAPEVAAALGAGRPVVALETTVVTHGLPRPEGLLSAAEMQEAVRRAGAVPALIGILEGRVVVGLTPEAMGRLASSPAVAKVNPGIGGVHRGMLETGDVSADLFALSRFPVAVVCSGAKSVLDLPRTLAHLAAAVRAHWDLALGTGVVVANPVPEAHEMPRELYETALAVTPFLLERMRAASADRSVATNRALLLDNARVAGELAAALAGGTTRPGA